MGLRSARSDQHRQLEKWWIPPEFFQLFLSAPKERHDLSPGWSRGTRRNPGSETNRIRAPAGRLEDPRRCSRHGLGIRRLQAALSGLGIMGLKPGAAPRSSVPPQAEIGLPRWGKTKILDSSAAKAGLAIEEPTEFPEGPENNSSNPDSKFKNSKA